MDDLLYDNKFTTILDEMEDSLNLPTISSIIASGGVASISKNTISRRFQSLSEAERQKTIKDSIPECIEERKLGG